MKLLKKLICVFSFALFAVTLSMAPHSVLAEELDAPENGGQAVEDVQAPSEDVEAPAEEQLPSEDAEMPAPADDVQEAPAEEQFPSEDTEMPAPADDVQEAPTEEQLPSEDTEMPTPADTVQETAGEQVQADGITLYIRPSVYIEEDGTASAYVTVTFSGAAEAFVNVRLQQLRDGEWITLGAGMHFSETSPVFEDYTRSWPVDSGYYYRAYAIVELYDENRNIIRNVSQESVSIYY